MKTLKRLDRYFTRSVRVLDRQIERLKSTPGADSEVLRHRRALRDEYNDGMQGVIDVLKQERVDFMHVYELERIAEQSSQRRIAFRLEEKRGAKSQGRPFQNEAEPSVAASKLVTEPLTSDGAVADPASDANASVDPKVRVSSLDPRARLRSLHRYFERSAELMQADIEKLASRPLDVKKSFFGFFKKSTQPNAALIAHKTQLVARYEQGATKAEALAQQSHIGASELVELEAHAAGLGKQRLALRLADANVAKVRKAAKQRFANLLNDPKRRKVLVDAFMEEAARSPVPTTQTLVASIASYRKYFTSAMAAIETMRSGDSPLDPSAASSLLEIAKQGLKSVDLAAIAVHRFDAAGAGALIVEAQKSRGEIQRTHLTSKAMQAAAGMYEKLNNAKTRAALIDWLTVTAPINVQGMQWERIDAGTHDGTSGGTSGGRSMSATASGGYDWKGTAKDVFTAYEYFAASKDFVSGDTNAAMQHMALGTLASLW